MFGGFQPRPHMTGFTSLPNEFFELEVLSNLKEAELKILLATFRKTYGWISHIDDKGMPVYKLEDDISYSQYREMTGLSDASISSALKKLIQKGFVVRTLVGDQSGQPSRYKIRVKGEVPDDGDGLDMGEKGGTVHRDGGTGNGDNPPAVPKTTDSFTPDELFGRPERADSEGSKARKTPSIVRTFTSVWKDGCRRKRYFENLRLTQREMKHVKDMAAEYGEDLVLKAAEFFVIYYDQISAKLNINSPEPNVVTFYGFRRSIIPMAKQGPSSLSSKPNKPNAGREFDPDKFSQGGGDFWQTLN